MATGRVLRVGYSVWPVGGELLPVVVLVASIYFLKAMYFGSYLAIAILSIPSMVFISLASGPGLFVSVD